MIQTKIACCQFAPSLGNVGKNVQRIGEYLLKAGHENIDILLFPELITTGYLSPDELPKLCESQNEKTVNEISEAAKAAGVGTVFGFPEKDSQGNCYNSACFINSQGTVTGVYRKTHLWDTEKRWALPGNDFPVFDSDIGKITAWICYDTRFPEAARKTAEAGAEIAFVPTAWLGPAGEWYLALRARAVDNNIFVAGADTIQPETGCFGISIIAGPGGEILAKSVIGVEGIISAVLDPSRRTDRLKRMNLFSDRRLDLYGGKQ